MVRSREQPSVTADESEFCESVPMLKKPFSVTVLLVTALLAFLPLPRVAAQEPGSAIPETKTEAKPDTSTAAKPEVAPITLAIPFAVGKAYRYKATLEITSASLKIQAELTRRETTTAVKANGEILAEFVEEGGKVVVNGMENPIPAGKPIRLLMDRYSRLLLFQPGESNGDFYTPPIRHILAIAERFAFPRLPVKPGDTWTTEVRNPTGKSRRVLIKSTYLGTEMRDGVAVWKVSQTVEAATEDGTLEAEMTALLDPATGQLIQAEQTLKNVPTAAGVVTWKAKLARL
jgi:hypothetical protein